MLPASILLWLNLGCAFCKDDVYQCCCKLLRSGHMYTFTCSGAFLVAVRSTKFGISLVVGNSKSWAWSAGIVGALGIVVHVLDFCLPRTGTTCGPVRAVVEEPVMVETVSLVLPLHRKRSYHAVFEMDFSKSTKGTSTYDGICKVCEKRGVARDDILDVTATCSSMSEKVR